MCEKCVLVSSGASVLMRLDVHVTAWCVFRCALGHFCSESFFCLCATQQAICLSLRWWVSLLPLPSLSFYCCCTLFCEIPFPPAEVGLNSFQSLLEDSERVVPF